MLAALATMNGRVEDVHSRKPRRARKNKEPSSRTSQEIPLEPSSANEELASV
jgi:hypothetical protein